MHWEFFFWRYLSRVKGNILFSNTIYLNIKFLSIPYKGRPFNPGISSHINVTHACLVKLKSMLQTGIIFGILGFAPMIFTLLLS